MDAARVAETIAYYCWMHGVARCTACLGPHQFVSPISGPVPGWINSPADVDLSRGGVLADGTVILVKLTGGIPRTLSFTAEEWTAQVSHRSISYRRGSASA
jgi:hypothetical protein